MSEDNMQNDDLNKPASDSDNISGVNPAMNNNADVEQNTGIPPISPTGPEPINLTPMEPNDVNSGAVDYDFTNLQPEAHPENPAQNPHYEEQHEVKLDQTQNSDPVTVRPVEFTPFDSYTPTNTDTNKNLELLMDIKLELTVELGRCQLPVKKVLELTRGSIIELDKVAGESVELYANGKHVANGEVVVIEDNFGLRITSITDPEERVKGL